MPDFFGMIQAWFDSMLDLLAQIKLPKGYSEAFRFFQRSFNKDLWRTAAHLSSKTTLSGVVLYWFKCSTLDGLVINIARKPIVDLEVPLGINSLKSPYKDSNT